MACRGMKSCGEQGQFVRKDGDRTNMAEIKNSTTVHVTTHAKHRKIHLMAKIGEYCCVVEEAHLVVFPNEAINHHKE